jgi:hypothetical protein
VGEFVLCRTKPVDGENMDRGGNKPLPPAPHGCGVSPVWNPGGVLKNGAYGSTGATLPFGVAPEALTVDEALLSDVEFDGGVRRFPTLTAAVVGSMVPVKEGYLCCIGANCVRLLGGGSSKLGRFDAACLRCVRLEGALSAFSASRDDPIGATRTEARAMCCLQTGSSC